MENSLLQTLSQNHAEAIALLELIDSLTMPDSSLESRCQSLQETLFGVLAEASSALGGKNSLNTEHQLHQVAHQVRQLCLDIAHKTTTGQYKSPVQPHSVQLASGSQLSYSYERNLAPTILEQRLALEGTSQSGWQGQHLLFSSGMVSLMMAVQSCFRETIPQADKPLKLAMWGGYFETHFLLDILANPGLAWTQLQTQADLWQYLARGEIDILLLEPVSYDWDMEVLDLKQLSTLWHSALLQRPQTIILDTTLVNQTFSMQDFLEQLGEHPPRMVVQVRSGMKLDQQGLELSNVGLLSVYTPTTGLHQPGSAAVVPTSAQQVGRFLSHARQMMGLGLTLEELACLDVPFFLDSVKTLTYAKSVFANNAELALAVQQTVDSTANSIIKQVAHPALSAQSHFAWACAPFVILHLIADTAANHALLLAILETERRRQEILLFPGGSFGFRHHRFEVIWIKSNQQVGLFKVAMGARQGDSKDATIRLLKQLASYSSYQELAQSYPEAAQLARSLTS